MYFISENFVYDVTKSKKFVTEKKDYTEIQKMLQEEAKWIATAEKNVRASMKWS